MRPIDADALNNTLKIFKFYDIVRSYIDTAPTVEPICHYLSDNEVKQPCIKGPCEKPQCNQIVWEQGYDAGYLNGYKVGYIDGLKGVNNEDHD